MLGSGRLLRVSYTTLSPLRAEKANHVYNDVVGALLPTRFTSISLSWEVRNFTCQERKE